MDQAPEPQRQPEAAAPPPGGTAARGRLVRRTDNKVIAGVASGIADALGIKPVLVRIATSTAERRAREAHRRMSLGDRI